MPEDLGRDSKRGMRRLSPTLVPSVVLQLVALLRHSYVSSEVLPTDWNQQVSALLLVSIVLSLVLGFAASTTVKVLISLLKIVVYGFITFPPGGHLTV